MASRFSIESVFKAVDKVSAPVTRMQNKINKSLRSTRINISKLDRSLGKTVKTMGSITRSAVKLGVIGIAGLATAVTLLIREFSKIEDAEAAFTPLLGGVKKAKQLVEELNKTAASTPFQFETLAASANQLLPVMNGNIKKTIKTLRMLGDTSGGNAQKLDSITRGFTKAMLKGKVDMESLNMIAEAGVPIFNDLASVMGVKVNAAFFKMISAGKVTTTQLTKAFEKMTNKGGIFFGGMDIASKTTTGLWSTLKDNISLTAAELGSVLAPVIKDLIKNSIGVAREIRSWVKANRELISEKFIKFVNTVKTTISGLVNNLISLNQKHSIVDRLTESIELLGETLTFLKDHGKTIGIVIAGIIGLSLVTKTFLGVMTAVSAIMALSPFGLIVLGVTALVAGFTALVIWIDDIKAGFDSMPGIIKAVLFPIGLLIDAIKFIKDNIGDIAKIADIELPNIDFGGIKDSALNFLGFGNEEPTPQPQIVSPQQRTARNIEEMRQTSSAEITIRDESGRATVTKGNLASNIQMEKTGEF